LLSLAYQWPFGETWFCNVRQASSTWKPESLFPRLPDCHRLGNERPDLPRPERRLLIQQHLKRVGDAGFSRAEYDDEDASVRSLSAGIRYDF
jgi:hypothetical protein